MKLTELTPNPDNPRHIRDEKFSKLVDSIRTFDKMMRLRPMVVDMDGVILGGNMRYRALQHLGRDDIPESWVIYADLTEEEKREFIIKDNVAFGEWDYETLANDWDEPMDDWGLDVPTEPAEQPKQYKLTVILETDETDRVYDLINPVLQNTELDYIIKTS